MRFLLTFIFSMVAILSNAQNASPHPDEGAKHWADSVYNRLTPNERIGQLMIVRLSSIDFKKNQITFYDEKIDSLIHLYNIGGICLFQGSPQKQASLINHFQSIAKTPILMCIDAENGLGMRILDSVIPLPR
ncbi:MAG: serine hydrolase, partial [Bacteroidetes bacterium]|nr:serine hydrolase [Bacteroidota bacterium]